MASKSRRGRKQRKKSLSEASASGPGSESLPAKSGRRNRRNRVDSTSESSSKRSPSPAMLTPFPSEAASKSNKAVDIYHFFWKDQRKESEISASEPRKETYCKVCKAKGEADPRSIANIKYKYSHKTAHDGLRTHLENHHYDEYMEGVAQGKWALWLKKKRRELAKESEANQGQEVVKSAPFSVDNVTHCLADFIAADDQSINVVECHEFRTLLLACNPEMGQQAIAHRTRIRQEILSRWTSLFLKAIKEMNEAVGKISFTMDLWSDQSRRSFMCITAHWVGRTQNGLTLKNTIIAFHHLAGGHDGKSLAKAVVKLLDRAKITQQVGHWTLDNASNNDTFMTQLQRILKSRDIEFDAAYNRISCFPHIINLCSQRVIKWYTTFEPPDEDEDFDDSPPNNFPDEQTYEEALARDPITLARKVVFNVRSSGQRRKEFREATRDVNGPDLTLIRDVRHRWDSVYFMIDRMLLLRRAVDHLLDSARFGLRKYRLTEQEWGVLEDVQMILTAPHSVQKVVSGDTFPSLFAVIPALEQFMSRWELLAKLNPHLEPPISEGLAIAKKYYMRMDRSPAYIISMFINPWVRFKYIYEHWEQEYIDDALDQVRALMQKYRERMDIGTVGETPAAVAGSSSQPPDRFTILARRYGIHTSNDEQPVSTRPSIEAELTAWWNEPIPPLELGTDLVKYWTGRETYFPTIFLIAADHLPIQASSVPCERAFSSAAETDTKRRNRMGSAMMESLQMLKVFVKNQRTTSERSEDSLLSEYVMNFCMDEEEEEGDPLVKVLEGDVDVVDSIIRDV